jgi:nicotinate-nucleotide adenylyltransferase
VRLARLPPHAPGMRIGLFGGSFNPPHDGHLLVSRIALTRLRLDRLWWLMSPGNPLKDHRELSPLSLRMQGARRLVRDPRIIVTDIEAQIGARFTIDLIRYLRARCPGVAFVWIIGADNLSAFHRWRKWTDIFENIPVAVIDRPGATFNAMSSRAALRYSDARINEAGSAGLADAPCPAFIFLHGPRSALSSTGLRATSDYLRSKSGSTQRL